MKKILGSLLLVFLLVSFTSCKNNKVTIMDNPSEEVATALNLTAVKEGKALNVNRGKAPYYDVKVSNDVADSLFYQVINVDKNAKNVNLKPIAFNTSFADSTNATLTEFVKIMNDETNGITKASLGVDLLDDDNSEFLTGKISAVNTVTVPQTLEANSDGKVQLVVVYIPVYGIYYNSDDYHINVFLMVPVYYAFANESISAYTGSIEEYKCELIEASQNVWVLPSKN